MVRVPANVRPSPHGASPRRDVVAVVRCPDPVTPAGKPRYLRRLGGATIVQILAERLRKVPRIQHVVLLLARPEKHTMTEARRSGWRVLVAASAVGRTFGTLACLLRARRVAVFHLACPFVDPATTASLLEQAVHHQLSLFRIKTGREFAPSLVVTRNFILKALVRRLSKRKRENWRQAVDALLPRVTHREERLGLAQLTRLLGTPEVGAALLVELMEGHDFSLEQLQDRLAEPDFERQCALRGREYLRRELPNNDEPVRMNQQLADIECQLGCDEVDSFPTFVGLNMTSTCNAQLRVLQLSARAAAAPRPYLPGRSAEDDLAPLRQGLRHLGWDRRQPDEPRVPGLLPLLERDASALGSHLFDQRHRHDAPPG